MVTPNARAGGLYPGRAVHPPDRHGNGGAAEGGPPRENLAGETAREGRRERRVPWTPFPAGVGTVGSG